MRRTNVAAGDARSSRREKVAEAEAEYKELIKELKTRDRDEDLDKTQQLIKKNLKSGARLYPFVKKKPSSASIDARHIREVTSLANDTAKRLAITHREFDFKQFIMKISQKLNNCSQPGSSCDSLLIKLGDIVKPCFCYAPIFKFMYGALTLDDLIIKKRELKQRDKRLPDGPTVSVSDKRVEQIENQDDTPKEVDHIFHELRSLSRAKESLNFYETFVDPQSFTQTVENIFHSSFLIKENRIGLDPSSSGPKLRVIESGEQTRNNGSQTILSFSMEDYNRWIDSLKIKKRAIAKRS